jgi:hypothetical protein
MVLEEFTFLLDKRVERQLNTVVPCIFSTFAIKHTFYRVINDNANHSTSRRHNIHTQASSAGGYFGIFSRKCRPQRFGLEQYGFLWRRLEELQVGRSQSIKMCFSSSEPFRGIAMEGELKKSRPIECHSDRYRSRKMHLRSNEVPRGKCTTSYPTTGGCQSGGLQ